MSCICRYLNIWGPLVLVCFVLCLFQFTSYNNIFKCFIISTLAHLMGRNQIIIENHTTCFGYAEIYIFLPGSSNNVFLIFSCSFYSDVRGSNAHFPKTSMGTYSKYIYCWEIDFWIFYHRYFCNYPWWCLFLPSCPNWISINKIFMCVWKRTFSERYSIFHLKHRGFSFADWSGICHIAAFTS